MENSELDKSKSPKKVLDKKDWEELENLNS
jgi:hypothetical protein